MPPPGGIGGPPAFFSGISEIIASVVSINDTIEAKFEAVYNIFGAAQQVMLDDEIQALVDERQVAHQVKNIAHSNETRNMLAEKGIILEDTKDSMRWKRK